jgi:hypothetical protein
MEQQFGPEKKIFSSPEEELEFLRKEVLRHEAESASQGVEANRDVVAGHVIDSYAAKPTEEVLAPSHAMPEKHQAAIA